MLLMIDNYDSFTYNLVQYFRELGAVVQVVRNDECDVPSLLALKPDRVVISPGPCTPDQAGVSLDAIRAFTGQVPILGVCLGHQAIGQAFGATVVSACQIMHGKTSLVYHTGLGVFRGIEAPLVATRYHSLVVDKRSLPDTLEVTAWTQAPDGTLGEVMALRHRHHAVEGVQFHPESILSEHGHRLLSSFLHHASITGAKGDVNEY